MSDTEYHSEEYVCKELKEFISLLYSSTDMQEERDLLHNMIETIK